MTGKILTISTSADTLNGLKTGLWLEELAAPYYVWKENGFDVVIGAISTSIPIDEASLAENMLGPMTKRFLEDGIAPSLSALLCFCTTAVWFNPTREHMVCAGEAQTLFKKPVSIADIGSIDEYVAVYVPGGHGIVEDAPNNQKLASLLQQFYEAGKVVSSVCHGPASFTGVKRADGTPLVKDKKVGNRCAHYWSNSCLNIDVKE